MHSDPLHLSTATFHSQEAGVDEDQFLKNGAVGGVKQLLRRFHMTKYEDAFIKSGYGSVTVAGSMNMLKISTIWRNCPSLLVSSLATSHPSYSNANFSKRQKIRGSRIAIIRLMSRHYDNSMTIASPSLLSRSELAK
jgi:hypothetical protein